jgi:transposase
MARKLVVDWQEEAETLRELYLHERDGPLRTRLHALWLLRTGRTYGAVAELLGVSLRALQNWVAWYRKGGLAELQRRRQGGARSSGSCRLSSEQQEGLRQFTREGTCFRVADAQAFVQREYGVSYSYWGMWKLLHRLRLRPKRPRPQAAKASPEAQAAWKGGAQTSA